MANRLPWRIEVDDLSSPQIAALLELHAAEMRANSPEDACHYLPIEGLRDPAVTVWSVWVGDDLAGWPAHLDLDALGSARDILEQTDADTCGQVVTRGEARADLAIQPDHARDHLGHLDTAHPVGAQVDAQLRAGASATEHRDEQREAGSHG